MSQYLGVLLLAISIHSARGQEISPPPPPPQDVDSAPAPILDSATIIKADDFFKPRPDADVLREIEAKRQAHQAEDAGLASTSHPRALTLQEAYWLALLKPGLGSKIRETLPSSKELADEAIAAGFGDFSRFRVVFLAKREANAGPTFRDPTASFLDLLQLTQVLDGQHQLLLVYSRLLELYQSYVKGGASTGISRDQVEELAKRLDQIRSDHLDSLMTYRNALDAFKIELGLKLEVEIVPNLSLLAPMTLVFDRIDVDTGKETFAPDSLGEIVAKFPRPADLTLAGRSLLESLKNGGETAVFAVADQLLSRSPLARPGGKIDELDRARIRARIRRLALHSGKLLNDVDQLVKEERHRFILLQIIIAPPPSEPEKLAKPAANMTLDLANLLQEVKRLHGRIVCDWSEGHKTRVELSRDLGVLPYTSWDDYLKSF